MATLPRARVGLLAGVDPDDFDLDDINDRRKALAANTINVGRYAPTLGYRTVPDDRDVVLVEWLGSVRHTAEDLVRPPKTEACDRSREADELLALLHVDGSVLASEATAAANAHGLSRLDTRTIGAAHPSVALGWRTLRP